jgi:hypothetical protein
MARKINRKAQQIGTYSYYIALPKHWILDNRVDLKRNVKIEVKNKKTLIITAPEGNENE